MKSATTRCFEVRPVSRRFDSSRRLQPLASLLQQAWLRFRRWRAAQRAIRHLREIDAYLLDDIGIRRDDIVGVVKCGEEYRPAAELQIAPSPAEPRHQLAA